MYKNIIILLTIILFSYSCNKPTKDFNDIQTKYNIQHNQLINKIHNDSIMIVKLVNIHKEDSINIYNYKKEKRILKDSIIFKNMQIGQVKKYVKICIKDPKNKVFLLGWIKRALEIN